MRLLKCEQFLQTPSEYLIEHELKSIPGRDLSLNISAHTIIQIHHHHHHHHRHFYGGLNSKELLLGPLFWRGDNDQEKEM